MNNAKIWILSGIAFVVLAGGFIYALDSKKGIRIIPQQGEKPAKTLLENQGEEAAKATQDLINDARNRLQEDGTAPEAAIDPATGESQDEQAQTVEVVDDTSAIDVETGNVVNKEGKKVDTSRDADIRDAAQISAGITEADLPESGIKLRMYIDKIEPAQFTVQAGQAVNISAIGMDDHLHVFKFKDDALGGLFLSVVLDEVRSTTFNAPDTPGEYAFYDAMNNYEQRGAAGVMIVQ